MSENNEEGKEREGRKKQKAIMWEKMEPATFFKFHVFVYDTDKMLGEEYREATAEMYGGGCFKRTLTLKREAGKVYGSLKSENEMDYFVRWYGPVTMNIIAAKNRNDYVRVEIIWNNSHVRVILKVDASEYAEHLGVSWEEVA